MLGPLEVSFDQGDGHIRYFIPMSIEHCAASCLMMQPIGSGPQLAKVKVNFCAKPQGGTTNLYWALAVLLCKLYHHFQVSARRDAFLTAAETSACRQPCPQ